MACPLYAYRTWSLGFRACRRQLYSSHFFNGCSTVRVSPIGSRSVADVAVDWELVSKALKEGDPVKSFEEAPASLKAAMQNVVLSATTSETALPSTLPLALDFAAFCRAPDSLLLPLVDSIVRRGSTLEAVDLIAVLGSLNHVHKTHHQICHTKVTPIYDLLLEKKIMQQRKGLTADGGANLRLLCQSLVGLCTFHRDILCGLVDFLMEESTTDSENKLLEDFDVASDCLYALSFMRKSSKELFEAVSLNIEESTYRKRQSLEAASKLNWAYLAQGVNKPQNTMKVFMRRLFEHVHRKDLPQETISEISQILHALDDPLAFEEFYGLIANISDETPGAKHMLHLGPLYEPQKLVLRCTRTNRGILHVCALVHAGTNDLIRFPRLLVPYEMTKRFPKALNAHVVALFFLEDREMLRNIGEVSGVVKSRILALNSTSWKVNVVRLADVQHLRGEELDSVVVKALKEAC